MNIQINCESNVSEKDLTFIGHHLKRMLKEYEETKNNVMRKKYVNGRIVWYYHLSESFLLKENVDVTCNGKTLYFKINKEAK